MDTATSIFFALLRSGLWGTEPEVPEPIATGALAHSEVADGDADTGRPRHKQSCDVSSPDIEIWKRVFRLAAEQTVTGLIADGAATCPSGYVPKEVSLRLMSTLITTERRNTAVNALIAKIVPLFEKAGIPTVLVKGQAVAQCYLRPQGRMPGDIDLIVRPETYEAAKAVLSGIADKTDPESIDKLHFGAMVGDIEVEIHGTVRTSLGKKVNDILDTAQAELFRPDGCRVLNIDGISVRIPSVDFDALFIFVHLLQHFYCGGLGIRQLCDWARVLHTHSGKIDLNLLEARLKKMGIVSEWQAFIAFLVHYIGLPEQEAPLYDKHAAAKADKIWKFMEKVGNFGKKRRRRDRSADPYIIRKMGSFVLNSGDFLRHATIFPIDSMKFFWKYFTTGTRAALRGE